MTYPNVSVEDFKKKYGIEGNGLECLCGKFLPYARAFLTEDYAGLECDACGCGRLGASSAVPISEEKLKFWQEIKEDFFNE